MDKTEIMNRLQEHYNEALQYFPENRIVGIFLQGSQNYGLDIEGSDVDSKLIILPSLDDIVFARQPVSTTHVRANNEHIDFKDIRLMFATFRKQNMNFIEILFTDYKIINPQYEKYWNELIEQNEMISHYNKYRALKTMKGIASEKYFALEHHYPNRMFMIEKYGYDPKQLHHLFRIKEFLIRYASGEKYCDCLKSNDPTFLKDIKQGKYSLEEARLISKVAFDFITKFVDAQASGELNNNNIKVDELLDSIQAKIVRTNIEYELIEHKERDN